MDSWRDDRLYRRPMPRVVHVGLGDATRPRLCGQVCSVFIGEFAVEVLFTGLPMAPGVHAVDRVVVVGIFSVGKHLVADRALYDRLRVPRLTMSDSATSRSFPVLPLVPS